MIKYGMIHIKCNTIEIICIVCEPFCTCYNTMQTFLSNYNYPCTLHTPQHVSYTWITTQTSVMNTQTHTIVTMHAVLLQDWRWHLKSLSMHTTTFVMALNNIETESITCCTQQTIVWPTKYYEFFIILCFLSGLCLMLRLLSNA